MTFVCGLVCAGALCRDPRLQKFGQRSRTLEKTSRARKFLLQTPKTERVHAAAQVLLSVKRILNLWANISAAVVPDDVVERQRLVGCRTPALANRDGLRFPVEVVVKTYKILEEATNRPLASTLVRQGMLLGRQGLRARGRLQGAQGRQERRVVAGMSLHVVDGKQAPCVG